MDDCSDQTMCFVRGAEGTPTEDASMLGTNFVPHTLAWYTGQEAAPITKTSNLEMGNGRSFDSVSNPKKLRKITMRFWGPAEETHGYFPWFFHTEWPSRPPGRGPAGPWKTAAWA